MQSRTALRSFSSPEGDHLTLLNIYRASDELLEKSKLVSSKEKAEKNHRKWCKRNFINSRSLKHARDIHRFDMVSLVYLKVNNVLILIFFLFFVKNACTMSGAIMNFVSMQAAFYL